VDDLNGVLERLNELAVKEGSTPDREADHLVKLFNAFLAEGGVPHGVLPEPFLAAFLNRQKKRLTKVLRESDSVGQTGLGFFRLVYRWDEHAALTWLLSQLKSETPSANTNNSGNWSHSP
jgi:hypothetical protein